MYMVCVKVIFFAVVHQINLDIDGALFQSETGNTKVGITVVLLLVMLVKYLHKRICEHVLMLPICQKTGARVALIS